MKKAILILALLLIVACAKAPNLPNAKVGDYAPAKVTEDKQSYIDVANSKLEFEGYGPGKSHLGKFTDWNAYAIVKDDKIVGGKVIINAASVETGIEGLDKHLKGPDFFDSEKYPEIVFLLEEIDDKEARGSLEIRGVKKSISFPIARSGSNAKADFLVDMSEFGWDKFGVQKDVRIIFDITLL